MNGSLPSAWPRRIMTHDNDRRALSTPHEVPRASTPPPRLAAKNPSHPVARSQVNRASARTYANSYKLMIAWAANYALCNGT